MNFKNIVNFFKRMYYRHNSRDKTRASCSAWTHLGFSAFRTAIAPMLVFFVKLISGRKLLTNAIKNSILAVTMVLQTSLCFSFQKTFQCNLFHSLFWYLQSNKNSLKIFWRHHFKAELYRYIYIVILGKHLSEICCIV